MSQLAPSILSADFSRLGEDVAAATRGGAALIHVDVMDGHFVPNISFGATVMKSLLGRTEIPFDVHLMIENPEKYIGDFVTPNTKYITVHLEACPGLSKVLDLIDRHGIQAGVSINPDTAPEALRPILPRVGLVLVMSVFPGFGGQEFIPSALEKIRWLKAFRDEHGLGYAIEVDGGIHEGNLAQVRDAGADIIVAGSAVFKESDIESAAGRLAALAAGKQTHGNKNEK